MNKTMPNDRWIYTYDYAPDSLWEPWRDEVYPDGQGLDESGIPAWIGVEADAVTVRVNEHTAAVASVSDISDGLGDHPALLTFLLLADSHYTVNGTWQDTVASIRALAKRLSLSGIIHLGDLTDGLLPAAKTREFTERCMGDLESIGVPVYVVPGNHDYNYFRGNPEIMYPDRPQYYKDIPDEKLRIIFIDSFDPRESVRYGFTDYCVHWLEAALGMMPQGYCAIIFSHLTPLVRLQAWTKDIRNREKLIGVMDRHADWILAFINGHNHCDHLFNDLHNGQFPVISINCAKCEYFTDHKPEGAEVPYRRMGDRTQESFDILQIDADKRELYFTRFGAGRDRLVRNRRAEWC